MDQEDPIARQIREELKKLDGRAVAKKWTPDGEVVIIQTKDGPVDVPLEVDVLRDEPKGFTAEHKDVMEIIYSAVSQINEKGRTVPLTRNELVKDFGARPKVLKQLEGWGYIRGRVIKLVPKDDPKSVKGQAVAIFYYTPQGRAYVREHFDPAYGTPAGHQGGTPSGARAASAAADPEGVQQQRG